MNYIITEIYINNDDWPLSNVRYWRAYEDGRWRWVLYDLDFGFDSDAIESDWLSYLLTCSDCTKDVPNQVTVFRKLMQNSEFRRDFAQRFASHINISFNAARVNLMIDGLKAGIEPEMAAHIARWGKPASIREWNGMIAELREFANLRPLNVTSHLDSYLGSPGTAKLTVSIEGNGDLFVAGVKAPGSGYSGRYFKSIPVTLKAESEPGWLFMRWQETGAIHPKLTMFLSGDLTRTAVFEQASETVYLPAFAAPGS